MEQPPQPVIWVGPAAEAPPAAHGRDQGCLADHLLVAGRLLPFQGSHVRTFPGWRGHRRCRGG